MHGGPNASAPPAGRAGFFRPIAKAMKLKKSFALVIKPLFSISNILFKQLQSHLIGILLTARLKEAYHRRFNLTLAILNGSSSHKS